MDEENTLDCAGEPQGECNDGNSSTDESVDHKPQDRETADNPGGADKPLTDETADHSTEAIHPTDAQIENTADYSASAEKPAVERAEDSPRPLKNFGDYELIREIARGGMGVVYKARQASLNRIVALKMILSGEFVGEAELQRFRVEAEAAANLDHPGVVPVFEVGEHDGRHFFSMGFVDGGTLAGSVKDGPLSGRDAASYVVQIAEAVEYAHGRGVVHRDLKPSNVLLDEQGRPRVTDFGLAKRTDSNSDLTGSGQILGTPSFMAPEQAAGRTGDVGPSSDVYALGAILYFLATGRPPFQSAKVVDVLVQVVNQDPVSPRRLNFAVERDLETICLKCLHKEQRRRYESAAALAEDLQRFMGGEPIQARPIGAVERAGKWARRRPLTATLAAGIAIALVALVSGGAWYQTQLTAALEETEAERDAVQRAQAETAAERDAVKKAQAKTNSVLYDSLTKQAGFLNEARPPGFGSRVWEMVDEARGIEVPQRDVAQLRQLAVGSLGSLDFETPQRFGKFGAPTLVADVTPDGRFLFVGLGFGKVAIIDLEEGREVHRFQEHDGGLVSNICALSNRRVVTLAPFCKQALVWQRADDGAWLLEGPLDLRPTDKSYDLMVSPGLRWVVGWSNLRPGTVEASLTAWPERITNWKINGDGKDWKFAARRMLEPDGEASPSAGDVFEIPIAGTHQFDVSDTHLVVSFGYDQGGDNTILVYDLERRRLEDPIETHCGSIGTPTISRDGRFVGVQGHLGAEIFDRESGESLALLKEFGRSSVAQFVGDHGDVLLTTSRSTMLYSVRDKQVLARLPPPTPTSLTRLDSTGSYWLRPDGGDLEVGRLRPPDNVSIAADKTNVGDVVFSPDSRLIATCGEEGFVRMWDVESGRLVQEVRGYAAAFHPDGDLLAVVNGPELQFWSLPEGRLQTSVPAPNRLAQLRFNARGDGLAAAGWTGRMSALWRIDRTDAVSVVPATPHNEGTLDFTWSPSGKRLAQYTHDGKVRILDFDDPNKRYVLERAFRPVPPRSLIFLSEDQLFVRHVGELWDVADRKLIKAFPLRPLGYSTASPTRRFVAAGSKILDARTMTKLFTLPQPDLSSWSVAWSSDGRRLACTFDGGRVVVWNLEAVHKRLSTVDLAWESPDFSEPRRLPAISALLDGAQAAGDEAVAWEERLESLMSWANSEAPATATLAGDLAWLGEHVPRPKEIPFQASPAGADRVMRLIHLANALAKRKEPELAESVLIAAVDHAETLPASFDSTRVRMSARGRLGSLYAFSFPDRTVDALAALRESLALLAEAEKTGKTLPAHHGFWLNRHAATMLLRLQEVEPALAHMEKALAIHERNPDVFGDQSRTYRRMINQLKAAKLTDEAEAFEKRAVGASLLKVP